MVVAGETRCWLSLVAPTLATRSLPSLGVLNDPLPLPWGDLKGRLKAGVKETQHISPSQLPGAEIYPSPGTLTSLIFQVLPAASAGRGGGELPGSVGAGPAAPDSLRPRGWGEGGVWGADPG